MHCECMYTWHQQIYQCRALGRFHLPSFLLPKVWHKLHTSSSWISTLKCERIHLYIWPSTQYPPSSLLNLLENRLCSYTVNMVVILFWQNALCSQNQATPALATKMAAQSGSRIVYRTKITWWKSSFAPHFLFLNANPWNTGAYFRMAPIIKTVHYTITIFKLLRAHCWLIHCKPLKSKD